MNTYSTINDIEQAILQVGDTVRILGERTEGDVPTMTGRVRAEGTPISNRVVYSKNGLPIEVFPVPAAEATKEFVEGEIHDFHTDTVKDVWQAGQQITSWVHKIYQDGEYRIPKTVPFITKATWESDKENWVILDSEQSTLRKVFGSEPLVLTNGLVITPTNNQYPKLAAFGAIYELADDSVSYTVKSFTQSVGGDCVITLSDDSLLIAKKVDAASRNYVKQQFDIFTIEDYRRKGDIRGWGVDTSGQVASDVELRNAFEYAKANKIKLVGSGLVKCNNTIRHPVGVSADFTQCTFVCANHQLTGNFYEVAEDDLTSAPEGTLITSIRLRTSINPEDRIDVGCKGLVVDGRKVVINSVDTHGFINGGFLIKKGYEVYVNTSSTYLYGTSAESVTDNYGTQILTNDCEIDTCVVGSYKRGLDAGSANRIKSVHCWGYPAPQDPSIDDRPFSHMLVSVKVGSGTVINNCFCDSPDTALYDDVMPNGALIIDGYENCINEVRYRIHHATKPKKIKLIEFRGFNNLVGDVRFGSFGNQATPSVIYSDPKYKFMNTIAHSVIKDMNIFDYPVDQVQINGVTGKTGYLVITRNSKSVEIKGFFQFTTVDSATNPENDVILELPDGLLINQGATSICSQRSAFSAPANLTGASTALVYIDSESKLRLAFTDSEGVLKFAKVKDLRQGNFEFSVMSMLTNI